MGKDQYSDMIAAAIRRTYILETERGYVIPVFEGIDQNEIDKKELRKRRDNLQKAIKYINKQIEILEEE